MGRPKWYRDGLCFECTQCGNCCSGPPGYVWVTKADVARIAKFLGLDGRLGKKYVRRVGLRHSLTEKKDGDCIFLTRKDGRTSCSIYPVRPIQCRTWPFWTTNLASQDDWNEAHRSTCPGMNKGRHYDLVTIERIRKARTFDEADHGSAD
jgi:Fe-S-cluster containining protein